MEVNSWAKRTYSASIRGGGEYDTTFLMRTLAITYYISCLFCPLAAYEPHVCKEVIKPTPMHVMLFSVNQQRLFYKDINE
jgi:hypothetical protein